MVGWWWLAGASFAEDIASTDMIPALPALDAPLPRDERVRFGRLPGGAGVVMVQDPDPTALEIRLVIDRGFVHEDPGAVGVAHLVEHLVISGNPAYGEAPPMSLNRSYYPYFNAFTAPDRTVYEMSSSLDDVDDQPAIYDLLWFSWAILYNRPALRATFKAEHAIVTEELRLRDTPNSRAEEALLLAITDDPGADWLTAQRESVATLTVGDARRFYREAYRSPRATLVVVTGRDLDVTEKLVGFVFRSVRPGALAPIAPGPLPEWDLRVGAAGAAGDYEQSVVWSATRPDARDGTWADARASAASAIARALLQDRLDDALSADPRWFGVAVGASAAPGRFTTEVDAVVAPDGHEHVLGRVNAEVERLRAHGFAAWELEHARVVVDRWLLLDHQAAAWYSPAARADAIADDVASGVIPYDHERYIDGARLFVADVSADEVAAAIRADLAADRRVMAALGTPTLTSPAPAAALEPPPDVPPAAPAAAPRAAVEGTAHPALAVTSWRLPGGTQVLYKRMDAEHILGLSVHLRAHANPDRSWLAARFVAEHAWAFDDGDRRALAAAGASLDLGFDEAYASIDGYAPDVGGLSVLLTSLARRVASPPRAEAVGKARVMLSRPISADDQFTLAFTKAVLGPGAGLAATPEALAEATTERVAALWADALGTPGDDVIVIVGSAPPEDIGPVVASALSGLSAAIAPPPPPDEPRRFTSPGSWSNLRNGTLADRVTVRAWLGVQEPAVPVDDVEVAVLASVVASELTDVLREELHLTYHVSVDPVVAPGPVGVVVEWTTSPERVQESLEAAMASIVRMRVEEVDPATARSLQGMVDGMVEGQLESPSWWQDALAEAALAGPLPATLAPARPRVPATAVRVRVLAEAILQAERAVVVSQWPRGSEATP